MQRAALAGLLLLTAALAATPARADTHGWWGQLGPVHAEYWHFGFNEGAYTDGWSKRECLSFAAWAAQLRASLPFGVGVEIEDSTDTDEKVVVTLLRCRGTDPRCDHPRSRKVLRTPGLGKTLKLDNRFAAGILSAVAKATGQKLSLKPAPAPPLYTIQLLAARERKRADELASRINKDRAYVHKGDYVFNANCGPCNDPPEAKIEEDKLEGAPIHRVFVGNYEWPRDARADLAELARLGYADAFIRPL